MMHMDGWAIGCSLAWIQRHQGRLAPINILTSDIGNCIIDNQTRECVLVWNYRRPLQSTDHTCCFPLTCRQVDAQRGTPSYMLTSPMFSRHQDPQLKMFFKHQSQMLTFTTHNWHSSLFPHVQLLEWLLIPKWGKVENLTKKSCIFFYCSPNL